MLKVAISRLYHHRPIRPRIGRRDRKDIERQVVALVQNRRWPDGRTDVLSGQMVPSHNRFKGLVVRIDGQQMHAFFIRAAEVDVDEPPGLQTQTVRAVRCRRDGLLRSRSGDVLGVARKTPSTASPSPLLNPDTVATHFAITPAPESNPVVAGDLLSPVDGTVVATPARAGNEVHPGAHPVLSSDRMPKGAVE